VTARQAVMVAAATLALAAAEIASVAVATGGMGPVRRVLRPAAVTDRRRKWIRVPHGGRAFQVTWHAAG
jgi:hypothetical protein